MHGTVYSMLTSQEIQAWWRGAWTDIRGISTRSGHPASYPVRLAERLIRVFSFSGNIVLDPFAGTLPTSLASVASESNSMSMEIEPVFVPIARTNIETAVALTPCTGTVGASQDCSDEQPKLPA